MERIQEYVVPIERHGETTRFMRDMVTQVKSNYRYRNNLAYTPWSINKDYAKHVCLLRNTVLIFCYERAGFVKDSEFQSLYFEPIICFSDIIYIFLLFPH